MLNREKTTAPAPLTLEQAGGGGGRWASFKTFWFPPPQLRWGWRNDGKGNPNYVLQSLSPLVSLSSRTTGEI